MARKTAEETQKTRDAILTAAEELFAEYGFAATSLSQVAKGAGITKSLIHHHYTSKETLWNVIKSRAFERFADEQEDVFTEGEATPAQISETLERYFTFLLENPIFLRLLWWAQAEKGNEIPQDEDVRDKMNRVVGIGIEWLRRGQEAGIVRPDLDPALAFVACLGMLRHWFVARAAYDLSAPNIDADYLNTVRAIVSLGLFTSAPPSAPSPGLSG